jgi:hypothetical protein
MSHVYISPLNKHKVIVHLNLKDASLLSKFLAKANFITDVEECNIAAEELELKLKTILRETNYES